MEKNAKIGCVVLAAGAASRFGANKLAVALDGRSLIRRTLEAIPAEWFETVVVVTQYPEIAALAQEFHFTAIHNGHPELGISRSLQLGLAQLQNCDGALFSVSDQPLLRRESVAELVQLWQRQPEKIAALAHNGVRGNPCIFPARLFPELMALSGDAGGGAVIRRHPEALVLLETAEEELSDVDTPAALEALRMGKIR